MSGAHVIELGDITVGIVVPDREGLRFFAAERRFASLERTAFRTTAQIIQAAEPLIPKQNRLKHRSPKRVSLPARTVS